MNSGDANAPERWFMLLIDQGLSDLAKLTLDGRPNTVPPTPGQEAQITAVIRLWGQSLWDGSRWDEEVDTPRIRKAFANLIGGERIDPRKKGTFPHIMDFREALPRRALPESRQIEGPKGSSFNPERNNKRRNEILGALNRTKVPVQKGLTPEQSEDLRRANRTRAILHPDKPPFATYEEWEAVGCPGKIRRKAKETP